MFYNRVVYYYTRIFLNLLPYLVWIYFYIMIDALSPLVYWHISSLRATKQFDCFLMEPRIDRISFPVGGKTPHTHPRKVLGMTPYREVPVVDPWGNMVSLSLLFLTDPLLTRLVMPVKVVPFMEQIVLLQIMKCLYFCSLYNLRS